MKAEIISIGDEMTSGQRLDTNSQWLAQQLSDLAIEVVQMTTVCDQLNVLVQTFRDAIERADLVICTGGIGPTEDDLTRQAFAMVANRELKLDQPSLDHIKRLFDLRGREMPDTNKIQAMIPEGASVIANEHGTAPGVDMSVVNKNGKTSRLIALPGVPYEMQEMWANTILPSLQSGRALTTRHFRVHCFGAGESELAARLPGLIDRDRIPRVGITASKATITFRISVEGNSLEDCLEKSRETVDLIRNELGDLIFGEEDQTLESVVVDTLQQHNLSVAILDAAIDGLPQLMLQAFAKQKSVDVTGLTFGNFQHVVRWLENTGTASDSETYSDQFAIDLANALENDIRADISIVVIPGHRPGGAETNEKCTVAIRMNGETIVNRFRHLGHDELKHARSAKMVLNQLRLKLNSVSSAQVQH